MNTINILWSERYLSDSEVADVLGISRATVWRYTKRGIIPQPVKLGRSVRWDGRALAAATRERVPVAANCSGMEAAA